jgi:hypothetical protein
LGVRRASGHGLLLDTGNYTNDPSPVIGSSASGNTISGMVLLKGAGSVRTLLVNTNGGGYGVLITGGSDNRVDNCVLHHNGHQAWH